MSLSPPYFLPRTTMRSCEEATHLDDASEQFWLSSSTTTLQAVQLLPLSWKVIPEVPSVPFSWFWDSICLADQPGTAITIDHKWSRLLWCFGAYQKCTQADGYMDTLRQEFRARQMDISGFDFRRFYTFQWSTPPWLHVAYRVLLALYVDFWLVFFIAENAEIPTEGGLPWLVYLTHWTYILTGIFQTLYASTTLRRFSRLLQCGRLSWLAPDRQQHQQLFHEVTTETPSRSTSSNMSVAANYQRPLPWYLKLINACLCIISPTSLIISAVYFTMLIPEGEDPFSRQNLHMHIMNSVMVIVEHATTALPVRLLHVVYPTVYLIIYALFSVCYWVPDHSRTIYPSVLNWNYPVRTMGVLLSIAFVILPITHLLFFLIYRAKVALCRRWSGEAAS